MFPLNLEELTLEFLECKEAKRSVLLRFRTRKKSVASPGSDELHLHGALGGKERRSRLPILSPTAS